MRRAGSIIACLVTAACGPAPALEPQASEVQVLVPEKRCGDDPEKYLVLFSKQQLEELSDCTVLVGRFQEDSISELRDFAPLKNVRKIEGTLNVFRSPGFVTLHGLENLEVVEGSLFIHLNPNLESIAALGKLRTVSDRLYVNGNTKLSQAEVDRVTADVTVGQEKDVSGNGP